jgi:hypothetical protein
MTIVGDAIIWSITYNCHSDECNILIIQATSNKSWYFGWTGAYPSGEIFRFSPSFVGSLPYPQTLG